MTPRIISGTRTSEDILREYYKKQQEEKSKPKTTRQKPIHDPAPDFQGNESYILLPQTSEHPDILVGQTRLVYTPTMEQISKSLNINPQNNNNRDPLYKEGYLGSINYQQAIDLNINLGGFTIPINLYVEFLNKLRSGNALDENGNPVDSRILEAILDDIYTVRNPWRLELINGRYKIKEEKKGKKVIHTGQIRYINFDSAGKLIEDTEELDEDTLMDDKRISLDEWLRNPTPQGFPRKDVADGEFYYYFLRDGAVVRFDADSDRAGLFCDRDPTFSSAVLGVRRAKIRAPFHREDTSGKVNLDIKYLEKYIIKKLN